MIRPMAHLSKNQLDAEHLESLFIQLSAVVTKLCESGSRDFFSEFFGREEKIMFAKRLAVIVMCMEGNTSYTIAKFLKMSPSTTNRIRRKYKLGHYEQIKLILTNKRSEYKEFWRILEVILSAGLPPTGKGKWSTLG
jgi:uncharacterized protein YerC